MTTIQIFRKMFDYLVANKLIPNQTELARAAGLNEVSVSRILNGQVKKTKQETLWKVNVAFGNVFNPDWMRGDSDVMLAADLAPVSAEAAGTAPEATAPASFPGGNPSPTPPDSFAALLAAKDETIASKDDTIAALRSQLADMTAAKDEIIAAKDALISTLRQQYESLLHAHEALLHHVQINIDTISGGNISNIGITATPKENDWPAPSCR